MLKDPLIGQQLGNFRLDRLLGCGGSARVYCGWDVKLQRPVAIKVIDTRHRSSTADAARFLQQARTVASWRHENIAQIYYAGEHEGLYYLVMEYVEGLDLRALIAQYVAAGELMPHDDVLRLGQAIASALDHAHRQGIVHRAVKPSNVLVAADGRVVLTDFGQAVDIQQGSHGKAPGSAHYTAPEQARSSSAAVHQSDLYSLGVMLYEMLTGAVPFDDPSATVVALQHVMEAPPPPRQLNPQLNTETEAVLLKALRKAPEERYSSGQELLEALETALRAEPLAAAIMDLPPLPPLEQFAAQRSISILSVDDQIASHLQSISSTAEGPAARLPICDADLVGVQLDEYRLERMLGQGGMARIYHGVDVRLNRQVAIKVIDTPFRDDPDYIKRFEREAQAIARLEHPHIVRLYRYGLDKDLLYMAMQYIDGIDLTMLLALLRENQEWIDPQDARRIIRQVCEALDYAHDQGIIHRDVKPANIMLDQQNRAILTDFGLALLTESGTRGMVLGSPHYIAPEQAISSAKVVPQSDLYAVGVILYEMFTGERPFEADNPLDVALLHVTGSPRPPRELRPDMPPELEAVILKAMARQPADRHATGRELADALDLALETTALPAPTRVPPFPPPRFDPDASTIPPPGDGLRERLKPARRGRAVRVDKRVITYAGIGLGLCVLLAVLAIAALPLMRSILQAAGGAPTVTVLAAETATRSSLAKGTAAATARPAPSPTLQPPATTPPVATPSPPQGATLPQDYHLRIYKRDRNSLFVVNQGSEAFPLVRLHLGNDRGAVDGAAWGVEMLASGACVAVWADVENPRPPDDVSCDPTGARLVAEGKDPFWKHDYDVYYGEQRLATCKAKPKWCSIRSGEEGDEGDD